MMPRVKSSGKASREPAGPGIATPWPVADGKPDHPRHRFPSRKELWIAFERIDESGEPQPGLDDFWIEPDDDS